MSDITKIKIDNEREHSYKDFPANREFKKRAEDDNPGGSGWPSDLPLPTSGGYGYTEDETVHPIDEKYIPESGRWPSDLPKPSADGYGYTDPATTVTESEYIFTNVQANIGYLLPDAESFSLEEDRLYNVTINGVTYERCPVHTGSTATDLYCGDLSEDMPFKVITNVHPMLGVISNVTFITDGDKNFKIEKIIVDPEIHKIDEKYLPASGGAMVVEFVLNETMSGVESASKTVDEVKTAMLTGVVVGVIKVSMSGHETIMPLGCATANGEGTPAFACFYDTGASSWVEQIGVVDGEWAFAVEK